MSGVFPFFIKGCVVLLFDLRGSWVTFPKLNFFINVKNKLHTVHFTLLVSRRLNLCGRHIVATCLRDLCGDVYLRYACLLCVDVFLTRV